jgi:hypothetical protein
MIDTTVVVVEEIQRGTLDNIWYWCYAIATMGKYYWCTGARIDHIRAQLGKPVKQKSHNNKLNN